MKFSFEVLKLFMPTTAWLFTFIIISFASPAQKKYVGKKEKYYPYLFTYFTGNAKEEEQIRFSLIKDEYNFRGFY